MHSWLRWRSLVVGGAAMLVFVAAPRFLSAQAPVKRPLSYDTYDYWRSISGTRLSRDGQWLAYALTSQGEDGDLVVRNLKTGKDYHAPRGSNPTFTPDGRLVIFTVAPPKADEPRDANAGGAEEPAPTTPQAQTSGRAGGATAARTSMGIMTLADGKVTTVDRVAQFRLPDESSTWLAYHRPGANGRGAGVAAGAPPGPGGAERPGARPAAARRRRPLRTRPLPRARLVQPHPRSARTRVRISSSATSRLATKRPSPRSRTFSGTKMVRGWPTRCRPRSQKAMGRSHGRWRMARPWRSIRAEVTTTIWPLTRRATSSPS